MKWKLTGNTEEVEAGIRILCAELDMDMAHDGIPLHLVHSGSRMEISYTGEYGTILYPSKTGFFRALGLFLEHTAKGRPFVIREEAAFDTVGVMLDVSRNAVLKVETVKVLLRKMALMGFTMAMLYTEDIYELEGEPYFGYMRGRYSRDELMEMDEYADRLGIELVPCIQTLGHMEQFLKWEEAGRYKDTPEILLAGEDEVYRLVEKMISAMAGTFRSRRIHVGMDEAHAVGLGRYLELNGYCNRFDIMLSHLNRVCDIVRCYGLRPMFWGDMPFRLGSKTGDYPDVNAVIPQEAIDRLPKELQFIYWDYMTQHKEDYRKLIHQHKQIGVTPVYASGLWNWCGFGTHIDRSNALAEAGLQVCREEGLREVMTTAWCDNGAENNIFTILPGLQFFAEHAYRPGTDMEQVKHRFAFCTGGNYEAFDTLKYLDDTPLSQPGNLDSANPSKYLLWQDLLLGLFDRHVEGLDMEGHYTWLEEVICSRRPASDPWDSVFEVPEKLCGVLRMKSGMGIRIRKAYKEVDRECLKTIVDQQLPELVRRVARLQEAHRRQWFTLNKPFGWEVLDIRYGGLLARIRSAQGRLEAYLEGSIKRIEELEEERLHFADPGKRRAIGYSVFNRYDRIVTAGTL